MKKQKGYTLVEVLLSMILIMMFLGASVICVDSLASKQVSIEAKVENYVSLNKYVKYNAELHGKEAKMLVVDKKVKVVIENTEGEYEDISSLQDQLENLNTDTIFDSFTTNGIIYLPNGSMETSGAVSISMDETNVALVDINDWDCVSITYTNKTEDFNTDK